MRHQPEQAIDIMLPGGYLDAIVDFRCSGSATVVVAVADHARPWRG
jgi:hypothetical protein